MSRNAMTDEDWKERKGVGPSASGGVGTEWKGDVLDGVGCGAGDTRMG